MKNIVLCADGTGNLGGETPDSNVYKMYNAIDIHSREHRQITYYDNGVGTAANKYWRGFTGAFGFGFKRNVCDLYRFLAKHYDPGDQVFLFGFSRGAAEVRAFSGFIAAAGLVDGRLLTEDELRRRVDAAFEIYKSKTPNPTFGEHGVIPITCIGVWDTVSALGFPQDWRITGIGLWVLNAMFMLLDRIFDMIFPHRFYNYELTPNIKFAYHALAIDDERQSFTPLVWDEHACGEDTRVEQVWFTGAHSNVGGGYGRAGLANVTLEWMMSRVALHDLILKDGVYENVRRDANVHGRLYDSRDGLAVFYRFAPRDIQALCRNTLLRPVQIHSSVIERMQARTANYAPGNIPDSFTIVEGANGKSVHNAVSATIKRQIARWVLCREWLYGVFLEFTLVVGMAAIWFWLYPPDKASLATISQESGWMRKLLTHIADILTYVLPMVFDGLITVAVLLYPIIFGMAAVILIVLWNLKRFFRRQHVLAREASRESLLLALREQSTK